MDIDNAANFLVGSILFGLGFCVIVISLVCINNIIAKYWKPVKIWMPNYFVNQPRFATEDELNRIAPIMEKKKD